MGKKYGGYENGTSKAPFKSFKALYPFYLQTLFMSFFITLSVAIKNPPIMLSIAKTSIICFFFGACISAQVTRRAICQSDIDNFSNSKKRFLGFLVLVIAITGGMGFSAVPVLVLSKFNIYL